MSVPRSPRNCGKCTSVDVSSFCSCGEPPQFLCGRCIQTHYEENRDTIHTLFPARAFTFYQKPGYIEDLKKRLKTKEKAVEELRKNLQLVHTWKQDMESVAEAMHAHIHDWAAKVTQQADELVHIIESDIREAEEELEATLYDPTPILNSAIAASLRHYTPGTLQLLTLLTDTKVTATSHKSFLGSLSFDLQIEHPDYRLQGRLSAKGNELVLGLYEKLKVDYSTPYSRAALEKFGPYQKDTDDTARISRGPLPHDNGVYTGEWNDQSQRHGFGVQQWRDGTTFEGQWRSDQMHGRGRQIWHDGSVYEGEYQLNRRHGAGHLYNTDGSEYVGSFAKGKQHGLGTYTYGPASKSLCYYGEFVHDEREGKGALFWKDAICTHSHTCHSLLLSAFKLSIGSRIQRQKVRVDSCAGGVLAESREVKSQQHVRGPMEVREDDWQGASKLAQRLNVLWRVFRW